MIRVSSPNGVHVGAVREPPLPLLVVIGIKLAFYANYKPWHRGYTHSEQHTIPQRAVIFLSLFHSFISCACGGQK